MTLATVHGLERAYESARDALIAELGDAVFWTGELSASALSTATAVSALALVDRRAIGESSMGPLIRTGIHWLAEHQNPDGGWGDTTKGLSNISTTMLARAALQLGKRASEYPTVVEAAEEYINRGGGLEAVRARYGKDRTFAVPILTNSALAGLVDWQEVAPLPFELACLPQSWFHRLNLPVVSYALPALIAVGQARYTMAPPRNPLVRLIRRASVARSLRVLDGIQPASGGFLEAVPLTSFVTMSLAGMGRAEHAVARRGVRFLINSVRPDGSWPIDSNLSVWLTTLSTNALAAGAPLLSQRESPATMSRWHGVRDWLLTQQYRNLHPYTDAAPGGWGWTHLPGGVPDADDTAGALLALACLPEGRSTRGAAMNGIRWLLDLQNRDGGWPTFCRGWGHLPFDRSGSDLTAHALRALATWRGRGLFGSDVGRQNEEASWKWRTAGRVERALTAGLRYLSHRQRGDGSWVPLWFGNQYARDDENPTYGTARVLAAYRDLRLASCAAAQRGFAWLRQAQNADGGWGGDSNVPSSLEETALATEALLADVGVAESSAAVRNGLDWMIHRVLSGGLGDPAPIGLYFAKLWYFEKLYPLIFAVAALGRARRLSSAGSRNPELGVATVRT